MSTDESMTKIGWNIDRTTDQFQEIMENNGAKGHTIDGEVLQRNLKVSSTEGWRKKTRQ